MKRSLTAEDIQNFQLVSNPAYSPDGQWVVYEQQTVNSSTGKYESQLFMAAADGSSIHQLTTSGTNNRMAAWSPDGRWIAFISNRAFGQQLWILPLAGGEAVQVTRLRYGARAPVWSPAGDLIFVLTDVGDHEALTSFPSDMTAEEAQSAIDKEDDDWRDGPKRYTALYYKSDGDGFKRNRHAQLASVEIHGGSVQQLTSGSHNVSHFAVSPDGRLLAFTANRRNNDATEWYASDLYLMATDGGSPTLLNQDLVSYSLAFAPDGQSIAVVGQSIAVRERYWSAAHDELYVVPLHDGELVHVTEHFPDSIGDSNLTDVRGQAGSPRPVWSADGMSIYVLSTREGRCEVVRFYRSLSDTADWSHEVVVGGSRDVYGFAMHGDTTCIITYATTTNPGILATVELGLNLGVKRAFRDVTAAMTESVVPFYPKQEVRLDQSNDWLFGVTLSEAEPFYYTSADEWRMQGWVMKPADFQAGKRYPVILEIHGGPQLNYGYAMFHEMQWFANQGYAVIFVNPRGGMSYGQTFADGVRLKYGQGDAADVLNGLEAALSQFSFLDDTRVAVTGGSYGGFMTNWLVGHTDRFQVAVSQRSISNWLSFYGVSDIGPLFVESQLTGPGGNIIDDFETLWSMSPLSYAHQVKTPLLLLHSENDLRCPIEQAEQLYTYLKRQGKEVELVRIPNASHGLSRDGKPSLRIARLQAIFGYIDAHMNGTEVTG